MGIVIVIRKMLEDSRGGKRGRDDESLGGSVHLPFLLGEGRGEERVERLKRNKTI
jgi:hypothetical protein